MLTYKEGDTVLIRAGAFRGTCPSYEWEGIVDRVMSTCMRVLQNKDGRFRSWYVTDEDVIEHKDKPVNSPEADSTLGIRENKGKPKMSMLMEAREARLGEAAVLTFGAEKYARANWLKGVKITETADSLLRHLTAFLSGDDIDPESGLPHVDHIQCNATFLAQMFHTRPDMDDRPLETLRRETDG